MSNAYRVYGFIAPSSSKFGFSTPVFENDGNLYVQIIDNDTIKGFEPVYLDHLDSYEGGVEEFYSVGSNAVYCAKFDRRSHIFGDRSYISRFLKQSVNEYVHIPYFYKAAHKFCSLSEPEYLDDLNDKDYLLRQTLSNVMQHYLTDNEVKVEQQSNNCPVDINRQHLTIQKLFISHKSDSFDSLVKDIVNYAYKKHNNISSFTYISELMSNNLEAEIFPESINKHDADFYFFKRCLSGAIDIKNSPKTDSYNVKNRLSNYLSVTCKDQNDINLDLWESKVRESSLSLSSLSLASFISTSLINKIIEKDNN